MSKSDIFLQRDGFSFHRGEYNNNNDNNSNNNNDNNGNNIKVLSFVSQCRYLICIVTFRLHIIGLPRAMWSVRYPSPYNIVTCLLHHCIALKDCAELKFHISTGELLVHHLSTSGTATSIAASQSGI